ACRTGASTSPRRWRTSLRARRSGSRPAARSSHGIKRTIGKPTTSDRAADFVDLHGAHALVVDRGVQSAELEACQVVHQERIGAHAVERADIAGKQRAPLLVGEIERSKRLGWIGLHRRAKAVIAQDFAAQ